MSNIFNELEGFSKNEQYNGKNAWGDPSRMSGFTLWLLAVIRDEVRRLDPDATITPHCGYELEGHVGKTHPLGIAVDFHINTVIPYHELIGLIETILHKYQVYHLVGFGIYPCWNTRGFHLDSRMKKAKWGYIKPDGKKAVQVSFEMAKDIARLQDIESQTGG